jgi:MFS family permease
MTTGTGRVFYGWFALAGCALVIFAAGGAFVYPYGVFLPIMCGEFGWSRALMGAGLSLGILAFGLPSPLFSIMITRFGPRANIILGNILAGLGLAGMYLVNEIWHVYLLYGFIGITAGIGGYIASTTVINNWFIQKRSLALGIFIACSGLGGFVFPPLTAALVSSIDWRMSWLVLGGILVVVGGLIGGLLLIRNRPEDMGQLPDGVSAEPFVEAGTAEDKSGAGGQSGWQVGQVLGMPATWLIGVFSATNTFALGTMNAHQIAYIQGSGFSPMTAAMTLGIVSISSIVGSIGFGALALRFNIRYLASASFAIKLIALGILLTTKELTFIYVYAVLLGIGNGALVAAMPTFVGAYYGREQYARVLGVIFPFQIIGNASGGTVAGAIYDAAGTYIPAFALAAGLSLMGLVSVFLARPPKLT